MTKTSCSAHRMAVYDLGNGGGISGPSHTYRRTDPVFYQQAQSYAHGLVHSQAAANQRFCGVIAWCGFDYPSERGFDGVKYPGVIDLFRVPKFGAAIYMSQVDPKQRVVIEPAFYWDFSGNFSVTTLRDGALIWSNADKLELFLDGKSFVTLVPDTKMFPHLKYPPFVGNFTAIDQTTKPEIKDRRFYIGTTRRITTFLVRYLDR